MTLYDGMSAHLFNEQMELTGVVVFFAHISGSTFTQVFYIL